SAVASRPPRPLWREARDSNSVIAGLESAALPVEPASRKILAEGGGIELHGFSPVHRFRGGSATVHRHPLCIQILVPEERLALSLPNGNWVLTPARIHSATRALEHRSGLEPDKSGFAIRRLDRFGIQCLILHARTTDFACALDKNQTLAGEEGLEPSIARVRAECSCRCATPQHSGCGGRYRAGLSAFSRQRFLLISFPAIQRIVWR